MIHFSQVAVEKIFGCCFLTMDFLNNPFLLLLIFTIKGPDILNFNSLGFSQTEKQWWMCGWISEYVMSVFIICVDKSTIGMFCMLMPCVLYSWMYSFLYKLYFKVVWLLAVNILAFLGSKTVRYKTKSRLWAKHYSVGCQLNAPNTLVLLRIEAITFHIHMFRYLPPLRQRKAFRKIDCRKIYNSLSGPSV